MQHAQSSSHASARPAAAPMQQQEARQKAEDDESGISQEGEAFVVHVSCDAEVGRVGGVADLLGHSCKHAQHAPCMHVEVQDNG